MKNYTSFFYLICIIIGVFGFQKNGNAQIDSTFGNNGSIFTPLDSNKINSSVTFVQTDGKILVAGCASDVYLYSLPIIFNTGGQIYVTRFNSDGSLDSSFASNGLFTDSNWTFLSSIIQLSNGNLLVGGSKLIPSLSGSKSAIMALTGTGVVDTTFGNYGIKNLSPHDNFASIGLYNYHYGESQGITEIEELSSGKIMAYGSIIAVRWLGSPGTSDPRPIAFAAKMHSNGNLDTTFVDSMNYQYNGIIVYPYSIINGISRVISNGASRYLLGSSDFMDGVGGRFHSPLTLARINVTSRVDTSSFSSSNNYSYSQGLRATRFAFQGSKILCTGFYSGNLWSHPDSLSPFIGVQRYNLDGTIDTTFGSRDSLGVGRTAYRSLVNIDTNTIATDLHVLDDNRFIVVGVTNSKLTIVRFLANGQLDSICYNPIFKGLNVMYTAGPFVAKTPQIASVKDNRLLIASVSNENGQYGFQLSQYKVENESEVKDTAICNYSFAGSIYTSSGIYFDTLTTTSGCDSLIRLDLTINQLDTTVSQSGNILTANTPNASYQWYNCNTLQPILGDTNQSFTYTQNGSYAVAISKNGCIDTSACVQILTVGILANSSSKVLFKLYPNPTNGITNVEIRLPAAGRNIESNQSLFIYNQMGQLVREVRVIEGKNRIDLSDQAKGVYFVRYGEITEKVILVD